jgi:hypothetical protein
MFRANIVGLLVLFIFCRSSGAQCVTTIPGGDVVGKTFRKSESPYCPQASVRFFSVVIEPGVTFLMPSGCSIEVMTSDFYAVGTPEEPIVFAGYPGNRWGGFTFHEVPPGPRLEHFEIRDCAAPGLTIWNCLPTVAHGKISNNTSSIAGAGVRISIDKEMAFPELALEDLEVSANDSAEQGDGIYAKVIPTKLKLKKCRIVDNITHYVASPAESNATRYGWGIRIVGAGELFYCVIARNNCYVYVHDNDWTSSAATSNGGGLLVSGDVVLRDCIVDGNGAQAVVESPGRTDSYAYGGGLWCAGSVRLYNCIVAGNYTKASGMYTNPYGSGLYIESGSAHIENCTFVENDPYALWNNVSQPVTVRNSILYFNVGQQIFGAAEVSYSVVQGGYPGTGNFDAQPAIGSRDWRIMPGSPCIDRGDPDPAFNDACFPPLSSPGLGTASNDVGAHGGPGNCDAPHLRDCNADGVPDVDSIANGTSRDRNRNGIPDECEPDADGDGIPDDIEGKVLKLEWALDPAAITYEGIFETIEPFRGVQAAIAYNPGLIDLIEVIAGPDLPPGYELITRNPTGAEMRCGGNRKGVVIGIIEPVNGGSVIPAGSYDLFRLRFSLKGSPPLWTRSPIDFVTCLGPADAPYENVFTDAGGAARPFYGIDALYSPGYFRRGDVNDSGFQDIGDAIVILVWLFDQGIVPDCLDAADVNDSGSVNVTDAVDLLNWRFRGAPTPPSPPFPSCGLDTTFDELHDCDYRSCP